MGVRRIGVGIVALLLVVGLFTATSSSQPARSGNRAIERAIAIATGRAAARPYEQMLSSGVLQAVLEARGLVPRGPDALALAPPSMKKGTLGCSKVRAGTYNNVRVNQDCSLRRQSEEFVVIDPTDPNHLIAGQNDSRVGFNQCGIDYSFDRGKTWGDMLPPFRQHLLTNGDTPDAASDPAIAFDGDGNVYFSCIVFDVFFPENAVLVTKSNAAFGGTFFHNPANPYSAIPAVVVNESNPNIFHDKEFINADAWPASPKRNNVYVTWTRFKFSDAGNYVESPIYFSQSVDGGSTWSKPIEISGRNPDRCKFAEGKCNFDQGSWPFVGPDGTIYVTYDNFNTPAIDGFLPGIVGQHMIVKCPGTANCANPVNWTMPVRMALDYNTQPFGPPFGTICPAGRQCLPPNTYRLNDFGAGAVDKDGHLFFAWSDFRNGGPCTMVAGGIPVEPCANHDNDVFFVRSVDGGMTWSAPKLVSNDESGKQAQWQAWMDATRSGDAIYILYYDRQYGGCEASGCNDMTVAKSTNEGISFAKTRVTTSSMPNLTCANNPFQCGFLGDYPGVDADGKGAALIWGDTRPHFGGAPEEDIYYASFP